MQTHTREECHMKMKAEIGVTQQKPRSDRMPINPLSLRRNRPRDTLILDSWPPELREIKFLSFKPLSWSYCVTQPQEANAGRRTLQRRSKTGAGDTGFPFLTVCIRFSTWDGIL